MSLKNSRLAPRTFARITGAFYLCFIVASVGANGLGHIGLGDARQVADSITTAPVAFRWGLVMAFVSALLFLLAAWGLYVPFRGVHQDLALLFLLLNAVGVAIHCASMLGLVWAVLASEVDPGSLASSPTQAQVLVRLALDVYRTGFVTSQLFFGAWLFPLGYLVMKSRLLPWFFGVLLIMDGVGELVWFLQAFLLPAYPAIRVPGTVVALAAEVGLALWLLIRGVTVDEAAVGIRLEPVEAGSGGVVK